MNPHRWTQSLGALAVGVLWLLTSTAQAQRQPLLASHIPDAVKSGRAALVGYAGSNQSLQLAITLPLRNEEDLDRLLQQLYDPSGPLYHQYLSVAQFADQYGPTAQDYQAVVAWAGANGLTVRRTSPTRRLLDVDGTVDAINRAFGISLANYTDNASGRTFYAPDREPTVAGLAIPLLKISGLDNADVAMTNLSGEHRLPLASSAAGPYTNAGSGPGGEYLPSDIRAAYYGSGGLNGAGQIVGIFSLDGYLASDLSLYFHDTGMADTVPVTNVLVNGFNGGCYSESSPGSGTCDDGEQIIDIAQVMGMAPGLSGIRFYEGTNTPDILEQMASDNSLGVKVLSSSWYNYEFSPSDVDSWFKEFQAQGQTFVSASGDDASYNAHSGYGPPEVDPLITQVGGTDLTTSGPGGSWVAESAWAESGGGYQSSVGIPNYQLISGVITPSNEASSSYRNSPDIAGEANYDNPLVSNGVFYTGYGGTSFAAPRWAGLFALANQQAAAAGKPSVGFPNYILYTLGTSSTYASDFHDIDSGSNGFPAVTGYDLATGWGSPIGPALINQLTSAVTWSGCGEAATNRCTPYIGGVSMCATQSGPDQTSWTIDTYAGATVIANGYTITDSGGTLGQGSIGGGIGTVTLSRAPVSQPTVRGQITVEYKESAGGYGKCEVTISFQPTPE